MKVEHSLSLAQLAEICNATVSGDPATRISDVASINSAAEGDLVFAEDATKLHEALVSNATAIIAAASIEKESHSKPMLLVKDPKLAFARAASALNRSARVPGRDATALIDATARLAADVSIGPGAFIGAAVSIGSRTSIGTHAVIEEGVTIGEDCFIAPRVVIHQGTTLGHRVRVQAGTVLGSTGFGYVRDEHGRYQLFPQLGTLVIEDDVELGANCTLDRGALDRTVIRRGAKLDNIVHVGHNVDIGEDVVIAAQTGISGSSRIGAGAIVGGQVGIADHVEIEPGVILGAQSGIPSKKIIRGRGVVFWGTPARPIKEYLKELATLARLTRKSK